MTDTTKPEGVALPKLNPKFGDLLRNTMASERNPHRDAYFIRKGKNTGRLNYGPWYEMTDGKGEVWRVNPDHQILLESAPSGQRCAGAARTRDELLDYAQTFGATLGDFSGTISFEPFELERFVAALTPSPSVHRQATFVCANCSGSGVVDDGFLTHSEGGIRYENGPIKCVKDCPSCKGSGSTPQSRQASAGQEGVTDEQIRRILDQEACLPDLMGRKDQWPEILRFARAVERAALSTAAPESGWRPIETAPKDGREMFVVRAFNVSNGFTGGRPYTSDPWCVWRETDGGFARWPHNFAPTHWQPLPAAPTAGETL